MYPLITFLVLSFVFIVILFIIADLSLRDPIIATGILSLTMALVYSLWIVQKIELYEDKLAVSRMLRRKVVVDFQEIKRIFYGYKAATRQNRRQGNYLTYLCLEYGQGKQLSIVYFPFKDKMDFISKYILEHSRASDELVDSPVLQKEKEDTTKHDVKVIFYMYLLLYVVFIPLAFLLAD